MGETWIFKKYFLTWPHSEAPSERKLLWKFQQNRPFKYGFMLESLNPGERIRKPPSWWRWKLGMVYHIIFFGPGTPLPKWPQWSETSRKWYAKVTFFLGLCHFFGLCLSIPNFQRHQGPTVKLMYFSSLDLATFSDYPLRSMLLGVYSKNFGKIWPVNL